MIDELNKYAPREGSSPIKDVLLDIAERGRSLGIILIGAQQTASEVERRIVSNSSIKVVGRLDPAEAGRPEYGFLPPSQRQRATLAKPGTMFVSQPEIPVPLAIEFPFPAWATRLASARPPPGSGRRSDRPRMCSTGSPPRLRRRRRRPRPTAAVLISTTSREADHEAAAHLRLARRQDPQGPQPARRAEGGARPRSSRWRRSTPSTPCWSPATCTRTSHPPPRRSSWWSGRCCSCSAPGIEVIAIAGNHDHGPTFDAYRPLMDQVGIRLIGLARPADRGGVQRFTARSTGEQAVVATLPFLSQRYAVRAAQVITNTPAEIVRQYDQLVRDVLANLTAPFTDASVNLVMAHLTCIGGTLRRRRARGAVDLRIQRPGRDLPDRRALRRAGAPAPSPERCRPPRRCTTRGRRSPWTSASRTTPAWSAWSRWRRTRRPRSPTCRSRSGRRLRTITGTVEELLADPDAYGDDFLRLRVTQPAYAGLREQVLEKLPNALEVRIDPQFSTAPHRARRRPQHPYAGAAVRRLLRRQPASTTLGSTGCSTSWHDELTTSGQELTMRPVRLDIDGFASFRDPTTVDFADADYFALIGPTGSGKSTVIDAMTFALYGSAPRWGGTTPSSTRWPRPPTAAPCGWSSTSPASATWPPARCAAPASRSPSGTRGWNVISIRPPAATRRPTSRPSRWPPTPAPSASRCPSCWGWTSRTSAPVWCCRRATSPPSCRPASASGRPSC